MRIQRSQRTYTAGIALGASQSEMIDIEDAVAGSYVLPAAFTNVGATNLLRFGVSNTFGAPGGTPIIALLPSTTLATAQSQRGTLATHYPLPPDLFKFRHFRFDGVATEAAAAAIKCVFKTQTGVRWDVTVAAIANGQTASTPIALGQAIAGSVTVPPAFTGTSIGFQVSLDGGVYTTLASAADAAIAQGVAVDRHIPIPDGAFGFPWLRLVSGSAEGAARNLTVALKR